MKKLIILLTVFLMSCKAYEINGVENKYLLDDADKNKYFLVELIRQKQAEKKLGTKPMLVVGSKIIYSWDGESKNINLNKSDIKSVKFIESKKAEKTYGDSGKYGVVIVSKLKIKKGSQLKKH